MKIARNLSRGHVGTALRLERTDIAVELGSAIAKHGAVVHCASGVQYLVVWADVDATSFVPAKVAAREGAVIPLAGVAHGDLWRDPATDQRRPLSAVALGTSQWDRYKRGAEKDLQKRI